jgi:spermidine synthase
MVRGQTKWLTRHILEMIMPSTPQFFRRIWLPHYPRVAALVSLAIYLTGVSAESSVAGSPYGELEYEVRSEYSHVRIRRNGNLRSMMFVRDTQEEVVESSLDLKQPSKLLVPYTRFMFMSYAFRPQQEKVLIVGLGGGSMIHFLRRYDPDVIIDVVEIDPKVVEIADQYFGVRTGDHVKIITMDGVKYLLNTTTKYDVIYMDAFLKPSPQTDSTGVPLLMKTSQFYGQILTALKPDGLVVFNLNPHARTREDVATIQGSFPHTYSFRIPGGSGHVAVASTASDTQTKSTILRQSRELDRRFKTPFSFEKMARRMSK